MNISQQYLTYLNDLYKLKNNIYSDYIKIFAEYKTDNIESKKELLGKLSKKIDEINKEILFRLDITL